MTYHEIKEIFTEKVMNYLDAGFIINTTSMSGHQGEECKVDLVKGNVLLRVYLMHENGHIWNASEDTWNSGKLVLYVGKWNKPATHCRDSWDTVWMNDIETIDSQIFYELERGKYYIDNLEEALKVQRKHDERLRRHNHHAGRITRYYTSDRAKEIGANYLKRTQGYQRVCRDEITIGRKYDGTPLIVYRGSNFYKLK